jgi:uncharacterized protein (UPF0548 family)
VTAARELTYHAVGATRTPDLMCHPPAGFRPMVRAVRIGRGEAFFIRAAEATMRFEIQLRSGLTITRGSGLADGTVPVEVGDTAVLRLGPGPLAVRIPVRVVYVIDEARRRGFGYGTLRGHPECGEAAFVVEWRADDSVWLEIRTFSRPGYRVLWLGYPLLRLLQEIYTRRYERALLPLAD